MWENLRITCAERSKACHIQLYALKVNHIEKHVNALSSRDVRVLYLIDLQILLDSIQNEKEFFPHISSA